MTSRMAAMAEQAAMVARLKEQMLIVLMKRLADDNGKFEVPVSEVDDTYQDMLEFEVDQDRKVFVFTLSKKT